MNGVALFILRRLFLGAITLLVIITLSFFLQRVAPGGPFDVEREMTPAVRAALTAEWKLDRPLGEQYTDYLRGLAQWPPDFKRSMRQAGWSVAEMMAPRLLVSVSLGFATLVFSLLVAVPLGLIAALKKNSLLDHGTMAFAVLGTAAPGFVIGPFLKWIFALKLGWLPESRWTGPSSIVLPMLALSAVVIATVARLVRSQVLDLLAEDWMRTAKAKGLPPRVILFRHALRGALLPVVSYLGPAAASLCVGSVVIERVFGIPGLGSAFVDAAFNRDYTLVMGVVIVYSALLILMNMIADLLLIFLDPRQRKGA